MAEALAVLRGMAGLNGFTVNGQVADVFRHTGSLHQFLADSVGKTLYLPGEMYWYLLAFSGVLFLLPNSCQLGGLVKSICTGELPATGLGRMKKMVFRIRTVVSCFRPTWYWALLSGLMFSMALYRLLKVAPTEFLYFNF
jgi:hypothetical protein